LVLVHPNNASNKGENDATYNLYIVAASEQANGLQTRAKRVKRNAWQL
jgi:hypothetical protein